MFRLLHDSCWHIWKMIKHLSNGTERITFCFLFNLYPFFFLSNRIWDKVIVGYLLNWKSRLFFFYLCSFFSSQVWKKALLSKILFIFLTYFHRTWKIPFLLTLFSLSLCFFLSCAAGDFRHGRAGAGDEVYRSPDPGETDLLISHRTAASAASGTTTASTRPSATPKTRRHRR